MHLASDFHHFILAHQDDDPDALMLRYAHKPLSFPLKDAITQIIGRRKAMNKIPRLLSQGLLFPSTLLAEQCSSQFMADLHASLIPPGANVADLTFGLGIDAFTMAKTAATVHGVERDGEAVEFGRMNADSLDVRNLTLTHATAQDWAAAPHPEIDTIFIDPARRTSSSIRTYRLEDCSPNLCELMTLPGFANKKIIVKASPMLDINYAIKSLPQVSRVIIAAVKGDCKEMIIICGTPLTTPAEITVTAIDIGPSSTSIITVNAAQRTIPAQRFLTEPGQIKPGQYLYEPNAAMMKTTPWHFLETRFPTITKLAPNTHLFASKDPVDNFPGRSLRITHIYHSARQAARELKNESLNVATRGYPISPEELRSKLHLHSCADQSRFLFGTSAAGKNILILANTL